MVFDAKAYREGKVRDLNEAMADAATGDLLHFDIDDTQVTADKGVVRYLKSLDPEELPFWDLSGRPAYDESSPIGVISRCTGVPKVIGVYNRYGGGFGDGNVEAWEEFDKKRDESHPFILLTPGYGNKKYSGGRLYQLTSGSPGFFDYNPDCIVVHVGGRHLENWSGIANEGRIMLIGNPNERSVKRILEIQEGTYEGFIMKRPRYHNYTIFNTVITKGDAEVFDIDGTSLGGNRIILRESSEDYEFFKRSKAKPDDFKKEHGPFDLVRMF